MLAEDLLGGRARAARVDPQRRAAQDRSAGRRRSPAARRGQRAGRGLRHGAHRRGAPASRGRRRGPARSAASASTRSSGSSTSTRRRDRTLTLRYRFAHHLYYSAFYDSLRGTRRAALSRAIAERLVRRIGDDVVRVRGAARGAVRNGARLRPRRRTSGTARRRPRRGCTRTTRPRVWRGAGWICSAQEPDSPARAGAELELQITYGLALKTGRGYAVPEVGAAYARARALCRQVQGSRARRPGADRSVGAPRRRRRDHDVARRGARDAPAVRAARRSQPADDGQLVARRGAVPSRRAATLAHAHLEARARALRSGVPPRRGSGRPASSRASSAAASTRAR